MKTTSAGRAFVLFAALGLLPSAARADEIVHFANGAEMTVRSHTVEQDNTMVKLDLGGNNYITFPMAMVDKVVSAGKDVFLNPSFHPANQAIAGVPGGAGASAGAQASGPNVADTTIRGGGTPVGFVPQQGVKGSAGVMLGEVADALPVEYNSEAGPRPTPVRRRAYNPAFPARAGELPQTISPPSAPRAPVRMAVISPPRSDEPTAPPPASGGAQGNQPQDPAPEDPPEAP